MYLYLQTFVISLTTYALADPSFYKSANIDNLLGVNVFLNLINGEIIKRAPNLPFAMSTKLGWIISGTTNLESANSNPVVGNHLSINTDNLVKSFWELESIPNSSPLTLEEKLCEIRFEEHHIRDNNGRSSVMLPFKPNRKELWWSGPKWLMTSDIPFSIHVPNCQEALKEECKKTSCAVGLSVEELPIISRVSSFRKLQRVVSQIHL
ncbi:retrovirus-related Pol polyprotein from transposon 17.6 [Trichonephila clavata]|uniref:Retrovirus-related Pol polyprotein from transposon 17.6 n=1 Tax=Trichonephila clavata TaxID=2740835 RepID=A0A8X6JNZ9_TRICU|nr:retrovirus-related Pol polyprotein from transposon 17.6 [Trichonephila clavata]